MIRSLVKLKRAEVLRAVVQGGLQTIHHAVEIKLVPGVVVNLEVHVVPAVAAHGIASGIERVQIQDGRVHFVMEIAAAILDPFLLQIAGHDRDLVGAGADCGLEIDPVGFA